MFVIQFVYTFCKPDFLQKETELLFRDKSFATFSDICIRSMFHVQNYTTKSMHIFNITTFFEILF